MTRKTGVALLATALALHAAPAIAGEAPAGTLQAAIGSDSFTVSGSVRVRGEAIEGQFRPNGPSADGLVSIRSILSAEYDAGPVRIGAELRDGRVYAAESDSTIGTSEVNALELVQAYVIADLGTVLGDGTDTSLKLGRTLLDLGSRRLAATNGFRNTTNAFTGAVATWNGRGRERLTAFYLSPQQRLPEDREALLDNEVEFDRDLWSTAFYGAHLAVPKLSGRLSGEAYLYVLDEEDGEFAVTRNRQLVTPGIRLTTKKEPGFFDGELEFAWQTGTIRTGTAAAAAKVDVSAYTLHVEIGRTFAGPWKPRLSLFYAAASGDDRGTPEFERFDQLFGARRGEFGPTSLYGPLSRSNLVSPGVRVEVQPSKRIDAFVAWRPAWLDERTDSFARTGIVDAAGTSGKFAGQQLEARLRAWIVPGRLQIDSGFALFDKGSFLTTAPNVQDTEDTRYGYVDVIWTF